MRYSITTIALFLIISSLAVAPVTASDVNQKSDVNQTDTINVSTGEQLSTVIQMTTDDIGSQIDEVAFDRKFGNSENESEVVNNRIGELKESTEKINKEYRELVQKRNNGNISNEDFGRRVAIMSNEIDNNKEKFKSLRNKTVDDSSNKTDNRMKGLEEALENADSEAKNVIQSVYTGRSKYMRIGGKGFGLSVVAEASNGRFTEAYDGEEDGNENVKITVEEAIKIVKNESDVDMNVTETEIDDGVIEVELEGNDSEVEAVVDGSSGKIISYRSEMSGRPNDIPANPSNKPDFDDRRNDDIEEEDEWRDTENGSSGPPFR